MVVVQNVICFQENCCLLLEQIMWQLNSVYSNNLLLAIAKDNRSPTKKKKKKPNLLLWFLFFFPIFLTASWCACCFCWKKKKKLMEQKKKQNWSITKIAVICKPKLDDISSPLELSCLRPFFFFFSTNFSANFQFVYNGLTTKKKKSWCQKFCLTFISIKFKKKHLKF